MHRVQKGFRIVSPGKTESRKFVASFSFFDPAVKASEKKKHRKMVTSERSSRQKRLPEGGGRTSEIEHNGEKVSLRVRKLGTPLPLFPSWS